MSAEKLTGAQQANFHYYLVEVPNPAMPGLPPYVAECQDIIAALELTFAEGEALKALWRAARLRQGFGKPGASLDYDFDKVAHYGARCALEHKQKSTNVLGELFAKIYNPSKE